MEVMRARNDVVPCGGTMGSVSFAKVSGHDLGHFCCPTPCGVGGLKSGSCDEPAALFRPTPRGVGGLKSRWPGANGPLWRPTPRGVSGLKSDQRQRIAGDGRVPPHEGWWVEMSCCTSCPTEATGPTPRRVGGLKCGRPWPGWPSGRPTPRGVGGLKYEEDCRDRVDFPGPTPSGARRPGYKNTDKTHAPH